MTDEYITPKDIMKDLAKIYIELGNKLDELNRMIVRRKK